MIALQLFLLTLAIGFVLYAIVVLILGEDIYYYSPFSNYPDDNLKE